MRIVTNSTASIILIHCQRSALVCLFAVSAMLAVGPGALAAERETGGGADSGATARRGYEKLPQFGGPDSVSAQLAEQGEAPGPVYL